MAVRRRARACARGLQPADEAVAAAAQEASAEPAQGAARVRAAARRRARGAGRAAIASAAAAVTPSVRRMMWRRMATANRRRTPRATPVLPWEDAESWEGEQAQARRIPRQRRLRVHAAVASRAGPAFGRRRACAGRQPGNAGWFGRCRPARRRPGDRETGRQARRQDPRRAAAGQGRQDGGRHHGRRRRCDWRQGRRCRAGAAATADAPAPDEAKPARKTAARPRRPRKTAASSDA